MKEAKYDALQQAKKSTRSGSQVVWMSGSAIFWGILIGFIINVFLWFDRGYEQLMSDLQGTYEQQLSMLALRSKESALSFYTWMDILFSKWSELWAYTKEMLTQIPYIGFVMANESVQGIMKELIDILAQFFCIFGATCKVVFAKFFSLLASFWLFMFASILGAMDGLLTRYIRTVEGGRESTFIFHRVSDTVIKIPLAIMFFYLASPFYLNPKVMVTIMGILFFTFFYITTANLKKFL